MTRTLAWFALAIFGLFLVVTVLVPALEAVMDEATKVSGALGS
jgi:hypothetical protein